MTKNEKKAALRVFVGLLITIISVSIFAAFPVIMFGLLSFLGMLFVIGKIYIDTVNSLDKKDDLNKRKTESDKQ